MKHTTIHITDINTRGQGVGRIDNKVVFVDRTVPGDLAKVVIIQEKKKYMVGVMEELIEPSVNRTEPFCPYFGTCGGCQLQHIDYPTQLHLKEKRIRAELHKTIQTDGIHFMPMQGMATPSRYRNKSQFKVSKQGLGFYAENSHRLVSIQECPLQEFETEHLIKSYQKHFGTKEISFYNEKTHQGYFRGLHFRSNWRGELMAIFVVNGKKNLGFSKAIEGYLSDVPEITSAYYNYNPGQSNALLGNKSEHIWGVKDFTDKIGPFTFHLGPTSFFQVNRNQTERLYTIARDMLAERQIDTLYDCYCGVGSIGIFLSENVERVVGIEVVPQAVEHAAENARCNNVQNATYILGKAEIVFPAIIKDKDIENDVVVLDPPRKGCDPILLDAIAESQCPTLLYISCNPATLARDLGILTEKGYQVEKVKGVDMFPQTSHVEMVVLMSRVEK
jgi:23S rRNA (uracil1939-C5)-methyltransferase